MLDLKKFFTNLFAAFLVISGATILFVGNGLAFNCMTYGIGLSMGFAKTLLYGIAGTAAGTTCILAGLKRWVK